MDSTPTSKGITSIFYGRLNYDMRLYVANYRRFWRHITAATAFINCYSFGVGRNLARIKSFKDFIITYNLPCFYVSLV